MDSPLLGRIGWRKVIETAAEVPASPGATARAGAALGLGAATVTGLALALPHGTGVDERLVGAVALAAAAGSALLLLGADRLPGWSLHLVALCATALAALAALGWGPESVFAALPLMLVVTYVCWFFAPDAALAYLGLASLAYAAVLVADGAGTDSLGALAATVGTLTLTGGLALAARWRVAGLISELTDAVRRDPLTTLLNRRGFEEAFDLELERCRRNESALSVVVADLDRFKDVNDTLGHRAGDAVLREVGQLITRSKRRFDAAARVGGEEFAVVVPDTDEHGAYILAERVRTAVERGGRLTISFGVASSPRHGETADALLQAADQALYAAKRLGRNRTVISSAEVPGILARGGPEPRRGAPVDVGALVSLAEALDVRDAGNSAHSHRVARYAELVGRELGLGAESVERLRLAGLLHDVGRVAVPEGVAEKAGPLSSDEWGWVRAHPSTGARMLESTEFSEVGEWIRLHHERPDGSGYPDGLHAEDVPLEAAIIAVADAYEAMTSDRPYRPALAAEEAAEELRRGAGRQFDERAVEALLRVV